MESLKTESIPPPPAVIGSIKAGFDTIAAHITAILLPLVLDLFLWLGPRLSLEKWYGDFIPRAAEAWRFYGLSIEQLPKLDEQSLEILSKLNLFSLLRTFPIGISSLASAPIFWRNVSGTPLGARVVIPVDSDYNLLIWLVTLSLAGWIGGSFYFHLVARLIPRDGRFPDLSPTRAIGQTMIISMIWAIFMITFGLPFARLLIGLLGGNAIVGQVVLIAFSLMSMWLFVPLFFWPHGVFLRNENALRAILSSWKLARFSLPAASMFVLTVFLLGVGLNYLWAIPPSNSWMALIGIIGHAFVTTALLAGSFIYYRDMNTWLTVVLERMKTKSLMRT